MSLKPNFLALIHLLWRVALSTLVLLCIALPLAVLAQIAGAPALPDPTDFEKFGTAVIEAIRGKDYVQLLALGVMTLTFLLKRYANKIPKIGDAISAWLSTDPGSILLVFLGSFGGALAIGSHSLSGGTVIAAVKAAFYAMGGFAVLYKLLLPAIKWLWAKINPSAGPAAAQQVAAEATAVGAASSASKQTALDEANKLLQGGK